MVDWAGGDQPAVIKVVSQEAAVMRDGIAEFLKRQEAMMEAQNKFSVKPVVVGHMAG